MNLTLRRLPLALAVCRLPPSMEIPAWAATGPFFSITRTAEELSLIVSEGQLPAEADGLPIERGWRALMVVGPLDFALTGILATLAAPLAEAGIPIFALSTYDTDYLLIKADRFEAAIAVLGTQGHRMESPV